MCLHVVLFVTWLLTHVLINKIIIIIIIIIIIVVYIDDDDDDNNNNSNSNGRHKCVGTYCA